MHWQAQNQGGGQQYGYQPQQYDNNYGGQQQQGYQPQQYGQPQQDAYPMQQLGGQNGGSYSNDMAGFSSQITSILEDIRVFEGSITQISDLHSRRLATTDDAQQRSLGDQLTAQTQQTSSLTNGIRNRINRLKTDTERLPPNQKGDFETRKSQIGMVQNKFKRTLEQYQLAEKDSRRKHQDRMARQIRIVKPDASDQEVREAIEDNSGGQVFSQALMTSRQSGARAAFAEVQGRHQDLKKIEETLIELGQMIQDMSTLVLQQDEQVVAIEQTAQEVDKNVEDGRKQTVAAVKSARKARAKRWFCFILILVILIVIAIVVAIEVLKRQGKL